MLKKEKEMQSAGWNEGGAGGAGAEKQKCVREGEK